MKIEERFPYGRPADFTQIVSGLHVGPDPPRIIVAISPCRAGSTALLPVFLPVVDRVHYQPVKAQIRGSRPREFRSPDRIVFAKETIGPWNWAETMLDPIAALRLAGYERHQMTLVFMLRDPFETFISWKQKFNNRSDPPFQTLPYFIQANRRVDEMRRNARIAGIKTVTYVPELVTEHGAETAVKALFKALQLPYAQSAVNWGEVSLINNPKVTIEDNMSEDSLATTLNGVTNRKRYGHSPRKTTNELRELLSDEEWNSIQDAELPDLYLEFLFDARDDLGFSPQRSIVDDLRDALQWKFGMRDAGPTIAGY